MKESDIYSELTSIRSLMERSVKFISISGISGILAGCYALAGAGAAYYLLYGSSRDPGYAGGALATDTVRLQLSGIALAVLLLSLGTGILLSLRKARRLGQRIWNPASRSLFGMISVPLVTGGILALIFLGQGLYSLIVPAFLIFYGLALVAGSPYTFREIRWLGIFEVILGLLAAAFPDFGIVFWAIGFGVLHILYGSIMHYRYDR